MDRLAVGDDRSDRAHDALVAHARQQQAVAELSRYALSAHVLEPVLDRAVAMVADTLELDLVEILLSEQGAPGLRLVAGVGWGDDVVGVAEVEAGPHTLAGAAIAEDGPVVAGDAVAQDRFQLPAHHRSQQVVSSAAVPIGPPGNRIGVLAAHARRRRSVTETEVLWLRTVANVVAAVIERQRAEGRLRETRDELEALINASPVPIVAYDCDGIVTLWNPAAEVTFGWTTEEAVGRTLPFAPASSLSGFHSLREHVLSGERLSGYEATRVRKDGSLVVVSFSNAPFADARGGVRGVVSVAQDITARRRHEQALAFMAEASEALTSTLDHERTLGRVGRLAVPRLADCCIVDVVEEDERKAHALAVAHVDPAKESLVAELESRYPTDPGSADSFVGSVIREGRPRLVAEFDDELLRRIARNESHLASLRSLGLVSGLFLPLVARGRLLGAITLLSAQSGRRYDDEDLTVGADLARHAALAVDNARLYQQRSHIAMTLQRSLLPPRLPEIPGVEVTARYRPIGEGLEVGGDFYDVFQTGERTWMIAIGDVCGKGPEAAAVTGLARHSVRAAGIGEPLPSRVLEVVNQAVLTEFASNTFCTIAVARLELDGGARVTVACGGHPLPMRLSAAGEVSSLGRYGTLVGLFDDPEFADETVALAAGDTLVLFTDGLVEGYGGGIEAGEETVRALLTACAGADADTIADRLEASIAEGEAADRDDIAILVVRIAGGGA